MEDVKNPARQGRVVFPIMLDALAVVVICALALISIKRQNVEQVGVTPFISQAEWSHPANLVRSMSPKTPISA